MRRKNIESVADVLKQVLVESKLDDRLKEVELIGSWEAVMGGAINRYTSSLYIRHHILYVHLTSSVLRSELAMNRARIFDNLNNRVGGKVIVDIVFR